MDPLVSMPGAVRWLCTEKELEKTNQQIMRESLGLFKTEALFGLVIVRTGCVSCGGGRGRDPLDGDCRPQREPRRRASGLGLSMK